MTHDIRSERSDDFASIREVTEVAFAGTTYASGDEQDIVDRLRSAGALPVSLVATIDGEVIGHVAFSPAKAADATGPWFTLGPVSVHPDKQRQGIGVVGILVNPLLQPAHIRGRIACREPVQEPRKWLLLRRVRSRSGRS